MLVNSAYNPSICYQSGSLAVSVYGSLKTMALLESGWLIVSRCLEGPWWRPQVRICQTVKLFSYCECLWNFDLFNSEGTSQAFTVSFADIFLNIFPPQTQICFSRVTFLSYLDIEMPTSWHGTWNISFCVFSIHQGKRASLKHSVTYEWVDWLQFGVFPDGWAFNTWNLSNPADDRLGGVQPRPSGF